MDVVDLAAAGEIVDAAASWDETSDVFVTALVLWHRDAVSAGRTKASRFIHKELLAFLSPPSRSTSAGGLGGAASLSLSSALILPAAEGSWRASLSGEWVTAAYRSLLTDRLLSAEFDKIVKALLLLLAEPQPQVRARVLRTFSGIMQVDPDLITQDSMRDAETE
jgi:hypothetical protein